MTLSKGMEAMVANPLKTSSGNTLQNSLTSRRMEAMVVRFEVDTPFDKMEERESLLRAPPFGEEEGSNGSLLWRCK